MKIIYNDWLKYNYKLWFMCWLMDIFFCKIYNLFKLFKLNIFVFVLEYIKCYLSIWNENNLFYC